MKSGANWNAYTNVVTITWPLNEKLRLGEYHPAIKSFDVSNNPLLDMLKLCTKLYILNQRPIFKTVHHHASVKDNSMKYYNFFFLEGEGFGRTTRYGKKTFSDELAVTQDVKATPPHL